MIRPREAWALGAAVAAALLVGLAAGPAGAEVRRFALVVGQNRGDASDVPLQFAEEDARRMHDVLRTYGGVAAEDALLLTDPDADTMRRQLIAMNERLRRHAFDPTHETLLFVFYSGHADAEALHLAGTRLDLVELKALVSGSPARMRVLVLDACQSGALTGVKGARAAPPFAVELDDRLRGEGVAFITSSAAGELSQESSDLGGSFFAHYFLVGLQGVADISGDGRVTLLEAYTYAAQRTLRATSRTAVGPQHPTYDYDIRGRDDVTLTDLTVDAARQGTLQFAEPGDYLVFRAAADGPLVAEVETSRADGRLVVTPGRYLVRLRTPAELRERTVFVEAGEAVTIWPSEMQPVAYERLLAKGGFSRGTRHGPLAMLAYRGETLDALGGMFLGGVSYPILLGQLWLQPRVLVGGSSFRAGEGVSLRQVEVAADLLLSYGFDFRHLVLLVGGGAGGMYLRQEASRASGLGNRSTGGFVVTARAAVVVPIQAGFYLEADAEAVGIALPRQGASTTGWTMEPTFRFGVGLGYSL